MQNAELHHKQGRSASESGVNSALINQHSAFPLSRRDALGLLAVAPFIGTLPLPPAAAQRGSRFVRELLATPGQAYAPKFFTPHEWETLRMLVDLVIPKDDRSGSATDAGVPEFMDFILTEYPDEQLWMRGGIAWLDIESRRRSGADFVAAPESQRTALLDDIAWPDKAPAGLHQGVTFFNQFRDLTASGFWSSQIGVADIQYQGNVFFDWQGCPPEQLAKLGVGGR
jgi:gluconate 2-dehydrogenase subunit 3-like protein